MDGSKPSAPECDQQPPAARTRSNVRENNLNLEGLLPESKRPRGESESFAKTYISRHCLTHR